MRKKQLSREFESSLTVVMWSCAKKKKKTWNGSSSAIKPTCSVAVCCPRSLMEGVLCQVSHTPLIKLWALVHHTLSDMALVPVGHGLLGTSQDPCCLRGQRKHLLSIDLYFLPWFLANLHDTVATLPPLHLGMDWQCNILKLTVMAPLNIPTWIS